MGIVTQPIHILVLEQIEHFRFLGGICSMKSWATDCWRKAVDTNLRPTVF
jgi:hypothetical protein